MSCTHDCGCSAETRDARTDDWGHTSPLSPQNADLREFQPAEPSQPLGTTRDQAARDAETDIWPTCTWVTVADQSAALPRPIDPEDVRVGMVVERRKGEVAFRDRVRSADVRIDGTVAYLWWPGHEEGGWTLWLVEDAPEPVDPDAAVIEAIITAYRRSPECSTHAVFGEAMLDHLRAQGFDVTARAEQ